VDHKSKGDSSKNDPTAGAAVSEAEQITGLKRSIESDQRRMTELHVEITGPNSEYVQAEALYKMIDEAFTLRKAELERLAGAQNSAAYAELKAMVDDLEKKWTLARERFNLAIQTRKTLQEQFAALEAKIKADQAALDKLAGTTQPTATGTTPSPPLAALPSVGAAESSEAHNPLRSPPPAIAPIAAPTATPSSTEIAPAEAPAAPAAPPAEGAAPAVSPTAAPSAAPQPPTTDSAAAAADASAVAATTSPKPASKELLSAQSDAQLKKEEAAVAEAEAKSVSERIAALEKDIELENKLLVATRKKADNAYQTAQTLDEEAEKRTTEGAPLAEQQELRRKRRDAEGLFRKARAEVVERTDRLNELQTQLAGLQREELTAMTAAEAKQAEAEQAERKVSQLQNPYSLVNLFQWLLDHGPKVLTILVCMFILRWMVRLTSYRVVSLMIQRGARGTKQEREDRAKTLAGVFHNAGSLAVILSGILMVCEEVGIAVGPLMGGAAVVGLAVAFGAQNLIRDYFYGFVILLENQYKLNDVLRIGDVAGQVEQITLRMTVLRDLEGNVHFIPNGKIDSVTNMTHGWSRAVLEIGVAYKEDADRVMGVLMDLANEMRQEPQFGPHILDAPEMLGVDSFGDSAIVIKFFVKTRPSHKWPVKRELLRRIKQRFDELGIEIPFPHRIVYHRGEAAAHDALRDDHEHGSSQYRKSA
jgi:small conductance mechanosensitive channel